MIPKTSTVADWSDILKMSKKVNRKRIEQKMEIKTYLDRLNYAILSGGSLMYLVEDRKVDEKREKRYTNRYTLATLFPQEDVVEAVKGELCTLSLADYIETVQDIRFPKRSEMRVFGKRYTEDDVYIKFRVELACVKQGNGENHVLVMSFHFSERAFQKSDFPYRGD